MSNDSLWAWFSWGLFFAFIVWIVCGGGQAW